MLRRADAEAKLDKKIKDYQPKKHYSEDYVKVFDVPGLAEKLYMINL